MSRLETPGLILRLLSRAGISKRIFLGDRLKSWDVNLTVRLILEHLGFEAVVLDFGAVGSEVPQILADCGYARVVGIDLDPSLYGFAETVTGRYVRGDFLTAPIRSASVDAITAISVIEHGYDRRLLMAEVSRLLKPGGLFIASFDYWPEKTDTSKMTMFNMTWTIFSEEDVRGLIREGTICHLQPLGDLDFDYGNRVVRWSGRNYSFAWLVMKKEERAE